MMVPIVIMFVVLGLLLCAISVPMILEKVKPNWLYGFRTPTTVNNPEIWYPVNAYAGKVLFLVGAAFAAASVVFAVVPGMNEDQYVFACLAVLVVGMLFALVLSFVYLHRLNKGRRGQ